MSGIVRYIISRLRHVSAIFVGVVVAAMACLPIDASAAVSVKTKAKVDSVEVKGHVSDENGEPLIGAFVYDKNTNRGVLANIDGFFRIKVPVGAELVVSGILSIPQTFIIDKTTRNLDVVLSIDKYALDELSLSSVAPVPPGPFESPKMPPLVGESSDSIPSLRGVPNNKKVKVRGRVRDDEGSLIGAVIRNPAASRVVFSHSCGEFEIDAIPGSELVVQYLGYDTQYFQVDESTDWLSVTLNDIGLPITNYSSYDTTNGWVTLNVYGPDGELIPHDQLYVCRVLDGADGKELYYDIMSITERTDGKFVFPWVYLLPNCDSEEPEVATLDIHGVNCKTKRITIARPAKRATIEVHLE